jgi:signal peptidase
MPSVRGGWATAVRGWVHPAANFLFLIATALLVWRLWGLVTYCESPVVVVLSGSMEPTFARGDLLVLSNRRPVEIGDVVVYLLSGRTIPIVHRLHHLHVPSTDVYTTSPGSWPTAAAAPIASASRRLLVTKGDNNDGDDLPFFHQASRDKDFLHQEEVLGYVVAQIPYAGYGTILVNDIPWAKYVLVGALAIWVIVFNGA